MESFPCCVIALWEVPSHIYYLFKVCLSSWLSKTWSIKIWAFFFAFTSAASLTFSAPKWTNWQNESDISAKNLAVSVNLCSDEIIHLCLVCLNPSYVTGTYRRNKCYIFNVLKGNLWWLEKPSLYELDGNNPVHFVVQKHI